MHGVTVMACSEDFVLGHLQMAAVMLVLSGVSNLSMEREGVWCLTG